MGYGFPMTTYKGLFPKQATNSTYLLPKVGDHVSIFGKMVELTIVEPYDDWNYNIEGFFLATDGSRSFFSMILPTDYRTDDGMPGDSEEYKVWIQDNNEC